MQFLLNMVETETGLDLDGDGKVGFKPMRKPQHLQQVQQQQPAQQPTTYQQFHQQQVVVQQPATAAAAGTRHRALFIGINYIGSRSELHGCINDVRTMQRMLQFLGFPLNDVRVLTEDKSVPGNSGLPTKANILAGLRWLVQDVHAGDTLFLHFSGHGTSVPDSTGDEEDGMDEALVPLDYQSAGVIVDDEVYNIVARGLPEGVRLTAVMDCCHSGTLMDLPFTFCATKANLAARQMSNKMKKPKRFAARGAGGRSGDVIMFSGCKDDQTSADVSNVSSFEVPVDPRSPGGAGGACTNALAEILYHKQSLKFAELLRLMQHQLEQRGFSQVPQMSSSVPVEINSEFSLWGSLNQ